MYHNFDRLTAEKKHKHFQKVDSSVQRITSIVQNRSVNHSIEEIILRQNQVPDWNYLSLSFVLTNIVEEFQSTVLLEKELFLL